MGVAEVESDASEAREHVRTLAHANTQLEAEVRMLRRTRDEHVGELASLRRAVGTATFERDAAAAQQQTQGEAAARTEETTMRQSQVSRRSRLLRPPPLPPSPVFLRPPPPFRSHSPGLSPSPSPPSPTLFR